MADTPPHQEPADVSAEVKRSASDARDGAEQANQQTTAESLMRFVTTDKWPTWAALPVAIICGIPAIADHINFYAGAIHYVGGSADMLTAVFPYIGLGFAIFGVVYMACAIWQEESRRARPWLPVAGWTIFLCGLMMVGTLLLFARFVESSNIPTAMAYFSEKSAIRSISVQQERDLKLELAKIKSEIPPLHVEAERETECLQYAGDLLESMRSGGLNLVFGDKKQEEPEPVDLNSTSLRGVLIGVQFWDAPNRPAVLLKRAFDAARLESHYVTVTGGGPDTLFVLVAPE